MNLRFINRLLIITAALILGILESTVLLAQTTNEIRFKELGRQIELKTNEIDLLRSLLEERVTQINIQKSKAGDSDKLKDLLSGSANLTNTISDNQNILNKLKNDLRLVSAELFNFYSTQIDSLNNIENKSEKDNVLTTLLIEKRLRVSPKIDILSFEPNKVIDISKEKLGKRVYLEFLTSASIEVENKLEEVGNLKKEIHNIIALNEETVSFLEEADFDNDISYFRSKPKSAINYSESRDASPSGFENTLGTQAESFSHIISQLNLGKVGDNKVFSVENIAKNQDLNEFKSLIDNVEQQLSDYKKVIEHKLKAQ